MKLRTLLSRAVAITPLAYFPVRVRTGPAKGAWWTLAPFSNNWRHGGENDLAPGLARLPKLVGAVCWDFGAHFGIDAVGMAMQVGPKGRVVAFEPDPEAFRRLKYHVQKNRLANVRLFMAAASNKTGSLDLITTHGLGSSMSHFKYEAEEISARTSILNVATVTPDELVFSGQISAPDLIKVDVQGHGALALQGSAESIRVKRPIIIFSNHSHEELAGTRELLEPLGYEVCSLTGEPMSWDGSNVDPVLLLPASSSSK